MAVQVQVGATQQGSSITPILEAFADASQIDVRDGHLILSAYLAGVRQTVAVFAPDKWASARLEQAD